VGTNILEEPATPILMAKDHQAIPVTGHGGPWGCKMLRFPHFLDNRFTDGSEVVSLMPWPPFTPRKIPGIHFCYRLSQPRGHSATGRIRSIIKSNDIRNQTCNLLTCSIVPQPTTLPCAHHLQGRRLILNTMKLYIVVCMNFYA
jgi:hypothetical protein